MTEPTDAARPGRPVLRRFLLVAAFAGTFAAGGFLLSGAPAAAMQDAMEHAGMHHPGMDHHGMDHEGLAAELHAHLHAHFEHMLAAVNATPEQKAKIEQILTSAFHEIGPVHHDLAQTPQQLHQLLAAPEIDRAALESLRAEHMAEVDRASRVLVRALADAAEVLTPEQRARLAAMHREGSDHHEP